MTKAKEPQEAAVPLPPASIDFNKLNDQLRAGKSGEDALMAAIHPDDVEYAMPKPVEEAVNGSSDAEGAPAVAQQASAKSDAS